MSPAHPGDDFDDPLDATNHKLHGVHKNSTSVLSFSAN
jgi:hypothetical protein